MNDKELTTIEVSEPVHDTSGTTVTRPETSGEVVRSEREDTIKGLLESTKRANLKLSDEELTLLTDPRSKYSPEEKMKAALEWYLTGSNVKAAKATGIPDLPSQQIYKWRKSSWWPKLIEKCRDIRNEEIEQLQTVIYFTSLEKMQDAVTNGDLKWDAKNGKYVRVPLQAKDLAYLSGTLSQQRAHHMGRDLSEQKSSEQKLKEIAEALVKTVQEATKQTGVTIHAKYEEADIQDVEEA